MNTTPQPTADEMRAIYSAAIHRLRSLYGDQHNPAIIRLACIAEQLQHLTRSSNES